MWERNPQRRENHKGEEITWGRKSQGAKITRERRPHMREKTTYGRETHIWERKPHRRDKYK